VAINRSVVRLSARWQDWPVRVVQARLLHLAPGDRIRLKSFQRIGCVDSVQGATPGDSCTLKKRLKCYLWQALSLYHRHCFTLQNRPLHALKRLKSHPHHNLKHPVPGMMTRALKSVPGMGTVGTSGTERGGYDRNRLQGRAFPVSSHGSRHDAQGAGGTVGSTGGNFGSRKVPGETGERYGK
jgi:hypothetical protein